MPRKLIAVRNGDIPARKEYRKIWKSVKNAGTIGL
jgi:hypothetical protein